MADVLYILVTLGVLALVFAVVFLVDADSPFNAINERKDYLKKRIQDAKAYEVSTFQKMELMVAEQKKQQVLNEAMAQQLAMAKEKRQQQESASRQINEKELTEQEIVSLIERGIV